MTDRAPVLEALDLAVRHGNRDLVRVAHLALEPGEVHVLLGPNGAGKTTLLLALNGLRRAQGQLLFEGRRVRSSRDRLRLRRNTAAVFQQAFLLSSTVRSNVESGLRIRGIMGSELQRRAKEALDMLGIAHLAERRRAGLSGGEAQRVSVARALAVEPSVLFLDEPMASLDPPTRRSLLADLQGIFERSSTAVLWVTHDTDEALGVADRVTFLVKAQVVQAGSPSAVFNSPAAPAVAEYLGIDVWLEGVVTRAADGACELAFANGDALQCEATAEGPGFACLHPEDVMLFAAEPPPAASGRRRNLLRATVGGVRVAGRSHLVTLDWRGRRLDALLTRAAYRELPVVPGEKVFAAVDASAVRVVSRRGGNEVEGDEM